MKRDYYVFQHGRFRRKDDSLVFVSEDDSRYLPVEEINDIHVFGEADFNTKFLNFVSQKGICVHVYNYYRFYAGSFYPRERLVSGMLLVKQVEHYVDSEKRLALAREVVRGASANIYRNMSYYARRGRQLDKQMKQAKELQARLDDCQSVSELMGVEGNIRKAYYGCWTEIINQEVEFEKRVKHPADNMVNTMISFLNGLVYSRTLGEIYRTQLNPTISYLHEPGNSRFSLSLDLAEIFKPLLADRLLFSLLNKKQITERDFVQEMNFVRIKDSAAKLIVTEFDRRLKQTIRHRDLKRHVSYARLVRLECYKLVKHLMGEKPYQSFAIWW